MGADLCYAPKPYQKVLNNMKQSTNRRKLLAGILTLAWLGLIWGNSFLPGENSAAVSGFVGELLSKVFGPKVLEATFLLRKLAHFTEFAILGGLLAWNAKLWRRSRSLPALAGLLAAMTDETIQLFSPGRASRVAVVWIDFAGLLTGLLLFHWFRRQKKNETERSRRSDV